MTAWIAYSALAGLIAYLCGSIPTGYWLGKRLRGIDLREHGSKSTGATNVLRTLGKAPAAATLLIDLLKGAAAVAFARWFYSLPMLIETKPAVVDLDAWMPWAIMAAALLAILGHSLSIFIRFTGGKSAATGLGVLLATSWQVGLGVAFTFIVVLMATRIVSLSSILASVGAVVLMPVFHQPIPFTLLAVMGAAYVVFRHRENVRRLFAGTEPRIGHASVVSRS